MRLSFSRQFNCQTRSLEGTRGPTRPTRRSLIPRVFQWRVQRTVPSFPLCVSPATSSTRMGYPGVTITWTRPFPACPYQKLPVRYIHIYTEGMTIHKCRINVLLFYQVVWAERSEVKCVSCFVLHRVIATFPAHFPVATATRLERTNSAALPVTLAMWV